MYKRIAHPDEEYAVRSTVAWNRRWGQEYAGLFFQEELAGPDGMDVQLFVTEDTPDSVLREAECAARREGDVVGIMALVVPPAWLEQGVDRLPALASIDALRRVVDDSTAGEIRWPDGDKMVVDTFTASMLVKVHDALRPDLQEKVSRMIAKSKGHFARMVDTGWEAING